MNGELMTVGAMTVGGGLTGSLGCGAAGADGWPYPYDNGFYQPWSLVIYNLTPVEPSHCIGKAHVFECEHVTHCKCGQVQRVMARKAKR